MRAHIIRGLMIASTRWQGRKSATKGGKEVATMGETATKTGGCQCGRVRFTAAVDPAEAYLCHCRMCQRATGGFAASFVSVQYADVAWQGEPDWYDSSPIARRPFCARCGTPLGFRFREGSAKMDLTVGSFDDPSDFVPKHHFGAE